MTTDYPAQYSGEKRSTRSYWRIVFILLIVFILVYGVFFGWQKFKSHVSFTGYQAVFLDNGQVYFGQIKSISAGLLNLQHVYYLQPNQPANTTQLALIKLGGELHGPTDEMFLSMTHVLFYENLRPDSKVVESIGTATSTIQ